MIVPPAPQRTLATRLYRELGRAFDALESWSEAEVPAVGPYPAAAVRRRLLQEAARAATPPLLERAARAEPADLLAAAADCGGIGLAGRVSVSARTFLRCCLCFAAHWGAALVFFARAGKDPRPCALLYGVGEAAFDGEDDSAFAAYCRRGPIEPLASAPRLLVESRRRGPSRSEPAVSYASRLLPGLHATLPRPPLAESLRFLAAHAAALGRFAAAAARLPALCLLWRDLAYDALAASLDRRGALCAVLLTNSDYDSQPLWMTDLPGRRFSLEMLWYSTNIVPHVYKDAPVAALSPVYRYWRADRSWVWSREHAAELERLGLRAETRIAGPLLWRLERRRPRPEGGRPRVGLFDVTPLDPDFARRNGHAHNYYSPETTAAFLREAADACRRAGARALLKPKRAYSSIHDAGYVALVRELSARGELELAGEEGNDLLGFLSTLDLAIVAPFSSPAHAALHLGVPAVYFDPTGLLTDGGSLMKVPLAAGAAELDAAVRRALAARTPI